MKNDRAWKAFEFFIPGLEKEVDMASDLMKAMFGSSKTRGDSQPIEEVAGEVTGEVAGEVTGEVRKLLSALESPLTRIEIQARLHLRGQASFRDRYLRPALKAGLIEMTIPAKPNSRLQKYKLTPRGKTLSKS